MKNFRNAFYLTSVLKSSLSLLVFLALLPNAHALPVKPQDPSSIQAQQIIDAYYGVTMGLPEATLVQQNDIFREGFIFRNITLQISDAKSQIQDIHFVLKMPVNTSPIPLLALFTGFQTGDESVNLIKDQGDNILMGFQYPMPIRQKGQEWLWNWSSLESIPLLMAVSLNWLAKQNYIDRNRINIMGVSFGTIFTPLCLRWLAQAQGTKIKSVILAYGGADISLIVGTELRHYFGNAETNLLKIMLAHQTWIYEPKYQLGTLRGDFLIVHGEKDQVFPQESKDLLNNLLQTQKEIRILPGPHIQPDRQDLIDQLNITAKEFLRAHQSIN